MGKTSDVDLGTLLGVWAHPDDETYLMAGLMARGVRNGARVVCVTATRGEEGTWDPARWPPAELGKVREAELMACLAVLGVDEHTWLDYHDGSCAAVDPAEGTARVQAIVEDVRPDSILTFGPDGMTGHSAVVWSNDAWPYLLGDLPLMLPTPPIYNDVTLLGQNGQVSARVKEINPEIIVAADDATLQFPEVKSVLRGYRVVVSQSHVTLWLRQDVDIPPVTQS